MRANQSTPGLDARMNGFIDKCVKEYRRKTAEQAPKKKSGEFGGR